MQNYEIKLHDIKPLVEIEDYSFYYFLGVVSIIVLLIATFLYFFVKWYKNKKSFNIRVEYFKFLKTLNIENAKETAYKITEYGALFQNDSEEHREVYEELIESLQEYKYKKNVNDFDKEIQNKIDRYLEMIDV